MRRKADATIGARSEASSSRPQRDPRPTERPVRRRLRPTDRARPQRDAKSEPACPVGPGWATITEPAFQVLDDLPRTIRLAERELDVIESYLGALLDEVLGQAE